LLIHEPPHGILDSSGKGCLQLRAKLSEFKNLKVVQFGHVHSGYGFAFIHYNDLIMDPNDSDNQVWNQPVLNYSLGWYNLLTLKGYSSYSSAVVKCSTLSGTSANYYYINRNPSAVYCLGTQVYITYVEEDTPDHVNQKNFLLIMSQMDSGMDHLS